MRRILKQLNEQMLISCSVSKLKVDKRKDITIFVTNSALYTKSGDHQANFKRKLKSFFFEVIVSSSSDEVLLIGQKNLWLKTGQHREQLVIAMGLPVK